MNNKKILIAGLHDTGKTTFIAALWYFVHLTSAKKKLALYSLAKGEHEYLNNISNDWLTFKRLSRTNNNPGGEAIIMNLKNLESEDLIELEIPDFSGETFKYQFENREWTAEYDNLLNNISGILLFVNAGDKNNRPQSIYDANEAAMAMGAEPLNSNEGIELSPWRVENAPNQVKLVDILQFISHYKPEILPVNIVLMISAWDLVEIADTENRLMPEEWIKLNLPLLHQFLKCNADIFKCRYVGISAQGCDYEKVEDINKVLNKDASERIIIKEGNKYDNDITKHIVWLTE